MRGLSYHGVKFRLRRAFCLFLTFLCCFAAENAVADTPLKASADGILEFQVTQRSRTLVVFLSGDGGLWGDLDVQLARRMAQEGYAVVGLDSRIWFEGERKPNEIAARVADLMRQYLARSHATRVVLAGYSFGADAIPIAYNRLAPEWRAKVAAMLLISPSRTTMLQVTLAERTGLVTGDYNLVPEFAKLPAAAAICVYGLAEAASAGCTLSQLSGANSIALPGGHHFENNGKDMSDQVMAALKAKGLP